MTQAVCGGVEAPVSGPNLEGLVQKLLVLRAEIDAILSEVAHHNCAPAVVQRELAPEPAEEIGAVLPEARAQQHESPGDPSPDVCATDMQPETPVEAAQEPLGLMERLSHSAEQVDAVCDPCPAVSLEPTVAVSEISTADVPALEEAANAPSADSNVISLDAPKVQPEAKATLDPKKQTRGRRRRSRVAVVATGIAASIAAAIAVLAEPAVLVRLQERVGAAGLSQLLDHVRWPFDLDQGVITPRVRDMLGPVRVLNSADRFKRSSSSRETKVVADAVAGVANEVVIEADRSLEY